MHKLTRAFSCDDGSSSFFLQEANEIWASELNPEIAAPALETGTLEHPRTERFLFPFHLGSPESIPAVSELRGSNRRSETESCRWRRYMIISATSSSKIVWSPSPISDSSFPLQFLPFDSSWKKWGGGIERRKKRVEDAKRWRGGRRYRGVKLLQVIATCQLESEGEELSPSFTMSFCQLGFFEFLIKFNIIFFN